MLRTLKRIHQRLSSEDTKAEFEKLIEDRATDNEKLIADDMNEQDEQNALDKSTDPLMVKALKLAINEGLDKVAHRKALNLLSHRPIDLDLWTEAIYWFANGGNVRMSLARKALFMIHKHKPGSS